MSHADGLTPPDEVPTARLPRPVARAAARWMTRLQAGDASTAQRDAFERWRLADPLHDAAWQRAERLRQTLVTLPPVLGQQVLDRPRRPAGRRKAVRALAVLALATPAAYLGWRGTRPAPAGWTAAYQTATGARRSIALPDGSRLQLNTATRVELAFDAGLRQVVLHEGELQIETAPDPAQRPFVVDTRHGRIRALGTRFTVRQLASDSSTRVAVQQSAVEIRPGQASGRPTVLRAGQQARFDAHQVQPTAPAEPQETAWTRGLLFANEQRLADFVAELARHRPGLLRCAPEVAELRISGVFRLDDTDAILAALPDTLPVRVSWRTRWWVGIAARPGA